MLFKFFLGQTGDGPLAIKYERPRTGGTLVQGEYMAHYSVPYALAPETLSNSGAFNDLRCLPYTAVSLSTNYFLPLAKDNILDGGIS